MKNILVASAVVLGVVACAVLGAVHWSIVVQPRAQSNRYKAEWVQLFSQHAQGAEIPAAWKHQVHSRTLDNQEWILAAMHHGSCCQSGPESFNATVFLDSRGTISTCDWAPCASRRAIGACWEEHVSAADLTDLYKEQSQYTVLTVVGTNAHIGQARTVPPKQNRDR
jgi:hypothetical protein